MEGAEPAYPPRLTLIRERRRLDKKPLSAPPKAGASVTIRAVPAVRSCLPGASEPSRATLRTSRRATLSLTAKGRLAW